MTTGNARHITAINQEEAKGEANPYGCLLNSHTENSSGSKPHSTGNGTKQTDPQAGRTLHKTYSQNYNYKKKKKTLTYLVKLKQKTRDAHLLK